MKVRHEILQDGRVILHLTENDGTPVCTQELSNNYMALLVARWTHNLMVAKKTDTLTLDMENTGKSLLLAERDVQPQKG